MQSLRISPETLARIKQPFVDFSTFAMVGNIVWKTCIAEGVTLQEFMKKKMVPRPDSIETFMLLMTYGLNSQGVDERQVILQFKFSGEVSGSSYFTIQKGNVEATSGISGNPDLTIESPFEVWMDIMTGKADGQQMLMEQKYKVNGDLSLMISLFRGESQQ